MMTPGKPVPFKNKPSVDELSLLFVTKTSQKRVVTSETCQHVSVSHHFGEAVPNGAIVKWCVVPN